MALVLNEDQQLFKNTAADFVKRESPVSRLRRLRDSGDQDGFSRELWGRMAELGWQSIIIPEAYGGLGMGYLDLACVLEECGRNLVPEPLISTLLLGANAVLLGGSEEQKSEILPRVAEGSMLLALAYHERGARYDCCRCETRAERGENGYTLQGEKVLVFDGMAADKLLVSARESGAANDRNGISLFLLDPNAAGVELSAQSTVDTRKAAVLRLSGVEVPAAALLGSSGEAGTVLSEVIDRATAGLCAEMLGSMQGASAMTLDYLKTREQFGVKIGSFQALKHRAVQMFVELELSRSAVLGACDAIDQGSEKTAELISVAKARCSDAAVLIAHEGIQMHGGIGMTDEHDIGFYAKRARACELTFGDAAYHRDRYARLQGF